MALGILITVSLFVAVLFFYCRSKIRDPNSNIRGPKSKSWWAGNLGELLKSEAGETDFRWQSQYGGIVRFKAAFGVGAPNWCIHMRPTNPENLQGELAARF
ncbi:cytochrome p450 [Moniliophthora roreri]|nr:cytochrome p450 [Moniliophthora roreri]